MINDAGAVIGSYSDNRVATASMLDTVSGLVVVCNIDVSVDCGLY